jgi:hypothetical protein
MNPPIHFCALPTILHKDGFRSADEGGNSSLRLFIFAKASDASGRVYYPLNGYHVRHHLTICASRAMLSMNMPIMWQHLACVIIDHEAPDRPAHENFTEWNIRKTSSSVHDLIMRTGLLLAARTSLIKL